MATDPSGLPGSVWTQKWYVVAGAIGAAVFLGSLFGVIQGDALIYRCAGAAAVCFSFAESESRTFKVGFLPASIVRPAGTVRMPSRKFTFLACLLYLAFAGLAGVAAYRAFLHD